MSNYFDVEKFERCLDYFNNWYDRAYYYLVYEGVKYIDAIQLRPEDVTGNIIHTKSGIYEISDACLWNLKEAINQKKYRRYSTLADDLYEVDVFESDCIIKFPYNEQRGYVKDPLKRCANLRRHLEFAKKATKVEILQGFTDGNVRKSGAVNAAEQYIMMAGSIDAAFDKYYDEMRAICYKYKYQTLSVLKNYCIEFLGDRYKGA